MSKPGSSDEFDAVVSWIMENNSFHTSNIHDDEYAEILNAIAPLGEIVKMYQALASPSDKLFFKEFLLWGHGNTKNSTSKSQTEDINLRTA